jgi:DNA-binding response OmpR family regulator
MFLMPSDVIRLGDALELDRRAYELRRSGRSLRLERIPMELLLLLVERRGELVTREEIIEKIWGKDVFLDTDSSINAAILATRAISGGHHRAQEWTIPSRGRSRQGRCR